MARMVSRIQAIGKNIRTGRVIRIVLKTRGNVMLIRSPGMMAKVEMLRVGQRPKSF